MELVKKNLILKIQDLIQKNLLNKLKIYLILTKKNIKAIQNNY